MHEAEWLCFDDEANIVIESGLEIFPQGEGRNRTRLIHAQCYQNQFMILSCLFFSSYVI